MSVILGDCLDVMKTMADESIDAIVTDPPYGISFMGRAWDHGVPGVPFWAEMYRVLKPGGYLLSFASTRTVHRFGCAIEDAGFEIRDELVWIYASGFPKSLDVSKALDRIKDRDLLARLNGEIRRARAESGLSLAEIGERMKAATEDQYGKWYHRGGHMFFETGMSLPSRPEWEHLRRVLPIDPSFDAVYDAAERECVNTGKSGKHRNVLNAAKYPDSFGGEYDVTSPATDLARKWEGWGTALKPAHEPVILGAKPVTVEQHFAIILEYLTAFMEDEWSGSLANDAVETLTATRVRFGEVASSVLEPARTRSLASIGLALSAAPGSTSAALALPDPTRTPDATALSHVRPSSNADRSSDPTTPPGKAAGMLTRLAAMSTSVAMGDISPSTVSSWRSLSADLLAVASTSTIETASQLTTALRILNLSMSLNTSGDTGRKYRGASTRPIVMARKPLVGTVAQNVTRYGTGALNIDGTRIAADYAAEYGETWLRSGKQAKPDDQWQGPGEKAPGSTVADRVNAAGRWPSNVLLSSPELFDEPNPYVVGSGATNIGGGYGPNTGRLGTHGIYGKSEGLGGELIGYGDSGGYSRFFLIPKADRAERERGLAGAPLQEMHLSGGRTVNTSKGDGTGIRENKPRANVHPTVKPIDLMRHLVRLVTPPGGTVLDPFLGSGTTAIAAEMEGFAWIGIEREPEYVAIAEGRLNGVQRGLGLDFGPTDEAA